MLKNVKKTSKIIKIFKENEKDKEIKQNYKKIENVT